MTRGITGESLRQGAGRRLYEGFWRLTLKTYFRLVHRIRIEGLENVPRTFDRLIVIANHASLLDGLIIWAYLDLPFRIVVDRTIAQRRIFKIFTQNPYTVLIDSMSPYSLKEVIRRLNEGTPLLIFPEGRTTRTGSFMKIYEGTGFAALRTGASILPIYLTTHHTHFSRAPVRKSLFSPVTMTIGTLRPPLSLDHLPPRKRKREAARMIYGMLSDVYLQALNRPSTLGRESIRFCKANGAKILYSDATGAKVSYRKSLIGAFVLGRHLSRFPQKNIGLLLPNLAVTAIIFMGLQLFRRCTAFLNYSGGPAALTHAMDLADLEVVITSRRFLERVRLPESLFAGRQVLYLEELKEAIRTSDRLYGIARYLFPGRFRRMAPGDEHETAAILFTSGSEGVPKGVCLSHQNIITNIHQGLSRIDVRENDKFLNALPVFHSFGLTVGTILPMFANAGVFLYVSPLHYRIVPEMAYEHLCTILLGTNTFLKGYGRRANAYDFFSMRYVFCGAEALTDDVFETYARTFGVRVMSGYGATECSPIISMNSALEHEYGTAGRVLSGIEYRLQPVEGVDAKDGRVGKLFVRGKNVMKGYLKNEAANHRYLVEDGGWYDTGDIVEITEEGFLKIVGRLKRFAKISGEMISLAAVEEALIARFGDRRDVAVLAAADERRGEKLLLITNNTHVELKSVREALRERGFSDLAVPKDIRFIKEIPKLGTGKVDYVKLREMLATHEVGPAG